MSSAQTASEEEDEEEDAISDQHAQIGGAANFGQWRQSVQQWKVLKAQVGRRHESSSSDDGEDESDGGLPPLIEDNSDEEDSSDADDPQNLRGKIAGGLRRFCPACYSWLMARCDTKMHLLLVLLFFASDCARSLTADWVNTDEDSVNILSVVAVQYAVSLMIAIVTTFVFEGKEACGKVFSWHPVWRFLGIAFLFTTATIQRYLAYAMGGTVTIVATVGSLYIPVAALLSFLVMKRMYGKLEWLSVLIISLAVSTFILLRERGKAGGGVTSNLPSRENLPMIALIVVSVLVSCVASIFAERIYKDRSLGLIRAHHGRSNTKFYIHKVHLDFASLAVITVIWSMPEWCLAPLMPEGQGHIFALWFGPYSWRQAVIIGVAILQSWLAGILTKHFSTLLKAIVQTISSVFVVVVLDPLLMSDLRFDGGQFPSTSLALIVTFAALVFQTGRLNVRALKSKIKVRKPKIDGLGWGDALRTLFKPPKWDVESSDGGESNDGGQDNELVKREVPEDEEEEDGEPDVSFCSHVKMYSSVLLFVIADSGRTLTQSAALSGVMITPMSMVLACFLCGVAIATAMSFHSDGVQGLKLAFSPQKILAALPCACFFALSSTLLSLAYANGISPALATVLGYVYMPVSALASRWVLGKFYMWLEWFALIILTLASAVFGYLQQWYTTLASLHDGTEGHNARSSLGAMFMVVASACSSVMGSLLAEKILKGERSLPFHIQKVRLDIGSVITTVILIFVIGKTSTRPQDAFWKDRPLDPNCDDAVCWARTESANVTGFGCASPQCTCTCGGGLFVAWSSALVILALVVNVIQSWLGGKVAKQFSTVMRAIAQSCSLLVIYFLGDFITGSHTFHDASMTLMALIVPLSMGLFMVSVGEMEKVVRLAMKGDERKTEL